MYCQPLLKSLVYKCTNINHICLICDEPAEQRIPLCLACERDLPWLDDQCGICALPLPLHGLTCGQCHRRRPAFTKVEALWHYGFPIDTLITRFKHRGQWPLGRLMAEALGDCLRHRFAEDLPRPDRLLSVPMAQSRLRQRGFNQAGMLARWLAGHLDIPCDDELLLRTRDTPAQQILDAKARQRNLRQAFRLCSDPSLDGLHLALVDDVLTTGSTAQALASLLRQAGARRVDVYCLARTPKPGQA
ncbi:ComF family protein [Pseudomonas capeferrum]|uniref:ComF family protein n=1 Tax=Pseudomonas capeferrum TaxID=1495066 RepID=UPI0015E421B7|nr:ComF family protein [Pseudomonas capeferrum]MBA1201671.1 ComF family protein [Pseudomonas capeferrum]